MAFGLSDALFQCVFQPLLLQVLFLLLYLGEVVMLCSMLHLQMLSNIFELGDAGASEDLHTMHVTVLLVWNIADMLLILALCLPLRAATPTRSVVKPRLAIFCIWSCFLATSSCMSHNMKFLLALSFYLQHLFHLTKTHNFTCLQCVELFPAPLLTENSQMLHSCAPRC